MAGHRCCCGDTPPGPGPPSSCLDVEWCNITTPELELLITGWHSMNVRRYTISGDTYCVAVEIEWDLAATLHRSWTTCPDCPWELVTGFLSGNPCECLEAEWKRTHEWVTYNECEWSTPNCFAAPPDCPDGPFPGQEGYPCFPHRRFMAPSWAPNRPFGQHREANLFASYVGRPAETKDVVYLVPTGNPPNCLPGAPAETYSFNATSAPQIVGTATRKLYNLTTSTLLEDQSYSINRDVACLYGCSFHKSGCLGGAQMMLDVSLMDRAPAGQQRWGVRFPSLQNQPPGAIPQDIDYHLMFDTTTTPAATFGEVTGAIRLVAPFTSSTAVPLNVDFIDRPTSDKALCCQNFSTTDCNGGDLVCTNDPSQDFQRCHFPYGITNRWQCYRKPTVILS